MEIELQTRVDSGEVEMERRSLEELARQKAIIDIQSVVKGTKYLAWYFVTNGVYLPISNILNWVFWAELDTTTSLDREAYGSTRSVAGSQHYLNRGFQKHTTSKECGIGI